MFTLVPSCRVFNAGISTAKRGLTSVAVQQTMSSALRRTSRINAGHAELAGLNTTELTASSDATQQRDQPNHILQAALEENVL